MTPLVAPPQPPAGSPPAPAASGARQHLLLRPSRWGCSWTSSPLILTLASGIEHAHGVAVVVGHEDAVRALVHRQGIGATAHGNGAYDPPAVSVEHAHATTAVVGDEDAPVTLIHGHRTEELARADGAQDGSTRGVKHAHAAAGVGDEGASGCLV